MGTTVVTSECHFVQRLVPDFVAAGIGGIWGKWP